MVLAPGTELGAYRIDVQLGAGGMGEVYRARDSQLGRDVAIKVLANLTSDPDRLRRFEQEARAAAALNHPNILSVYQLGVYEGGPYLVTELLDGETLREQIKRSRLPLRKAIDYSVQIARGLAAAHETGIVHRDLKPENLFVTHDNRVKILDFGLAKLTQLAESSEFGASTLTEGTAPGMVLGTVGYMSPEQVRGQKTDQRTDIFALGTILYEMLAGNRAFKKPTSAETMAAILNEDPPPLSGAQNVPTTLQRVVQRCLEKKPEARFQSASDLAFALEALSDSGVVSTAQATAAAEGVPSRRIGLGSVGAVVVIAAAIVFWLRPDRVPVIEEVKQLTDDGNPKSTYSSIVSDGSRVYFDEMGSAQIPAMQVSINGGQAVPVLTTLRTGGIVALTPDSSALMFFVSPTVADQSLLWLQPLPAGEPRRLGGISADDADFFPDGRIVFVSGPGLYVAEKDGSNPHKLVDFAGNGGWPRVSPDGRCIRFTIYGDDRTYSLWEMAADGTGLHQMFKGWHESPNERSGKWTQDGRYFVFQYEAETRWDLWALKEKHDPFHLGSEQPIPLTKGPLSYVLPSPGRDNQQIFAVGLKRRGELVRYDAKARQYLPYAGGPSAIEARVSSDGRWVLYVSYPDRALWRSRPDGSERLQLSYPPLIVFNPEFSPDGKNVAFAGLQRAKRDLGLYVISVQGGTPERIATGGSGLAWSPNQNAIAFSAPAPGKHQGEKDFLQVYVADLRTKGVSAVRDSVGLGGAFWSGPETLLSVKNDGGLMAFDFRAQRWSDFMHSDLAIRDWTESPDNKYLYGELVGDRARVVRLRLADRRMETVADLTGARRVIDEPIGAINNLTWLGATADGSLLVTRDIGTQEIYALKVKWP